ncbi:hypothetical protein VARIO8X_130078 [Burkholderiales bacterium 8X]|nr:hypothetical protein VARIO8X_130078 [Burkholderiales bacterium 8X]
MADLRVISTSMPPGLSRSRSTVAAARSGAGSRWVWSRWVVRTMPGLSGDLPSRAGFREAGISFDRRGHEHFARIRLFRATPRRSIDPSRRRSTSPPKARHASIFFDFPQPAPSALPLHSEPLALRRRRSPGGGSGCRAERLRASGLSAPTRHHDHGLPRRLGCRRGGPRDPGAAVAEARPTGGDRLQGRRGRQHRERIRGARQARRLHPRVRNGRHARQQCGALQEAALRRGGRLRSGGAGAGRLERADHQSGRDGRQDAQGVRRPGEGEPGQVQLRLDRQRRRHPHGVRRAQFAARTADGARAVQGRPGGDHLGRARRDLLHHEPGADRVAPVQGRQGPAAGRDHQGAGGRDQGGADDRLKQHSGHAGFRQLDLVRHLRSEGNRRPRGRQAQHRDPLGAGAARDQVQVRGAGQYGADRNAGRVQEHGPRQPDQMGGGRQGGQHQHRLRPVVPRCDKPEGWPDRPGGS